MIVGMVGDFNMGALEQCPTRVSNQSVPQECPTRVSHKSVLQECPTRVPNNSVPQECPTRVGVLQECPNAPHKCPTRVSYKSVPQECLQEHRLQQVLTRANNAWPFVFDCVCAFGFVGSILFSFGWGMVKQKVMRLRLKFSFTCFIIFLGATRKFGQVLP